MRVWLDPDRLQSLGMTANDVTAGAAGARTSRSPPASSISRRSTSPARSRFRCRRSAGWPIPSSSPTSSSSRPPTPWCGSRTSARAELSGLDYSSNSYLDLDPAVAIAVFQRPGSNALATAQDIRKTMADASKRFPQGLKYNIVYDPTQFIQQSVDAVMETILEAILLVVLVVVLFLQTWRAAIIPLVAIPVSLIGTFFLMAMFGFSLNNLSLFGLVLAVGIVVDDAIVVVENVERNIANGLSPRDAARRSMDEVGAALVAIALVLCAVFVPSAFITGISGQFYRQFALTIAGATVISLTVSLTLSPALCALLLQAASTRTRRSAGGQRPLRGFFGVFQLRLRQAGPGLWLARVAGGALHRDHAAGLCRHHRLRPQRVPQDADRLHPAARPRLSDRRGAVAAGRFAVAHRRGAAAHRRYRAEGAGRRRRGEHRRLLRRDLHQRAERRRGLPGARIRSRSAPRIPTSPPSASSARCSASCADPGCDGVRGAAAAGAWASATPAASA